MHTNTCRPPLATLALAAILSLAFPDTPDRNVSSLIVGAGSFIGIGRHDVAIPVTQIQSRAGRLTAMPAHGPNSRAGDRR